MELVSSEESYTVEGGVEGIGNYKRGPVHTRETGEEAYGDMGNTGLLGPLASVQSGEGEQRPY